MYVDIYALQNVPPSDLNRDDTGTPKTALYGGCLRARVSSQAWKRAMRLYFDQAIDKVDLGVRTMHAVDLIKGDIVRQRPDLEDVSAKMAEDVLRITGVKVEKSKRSGSEQGSLVTQYLIFIARHEIGKLARIAIDAHDGGENLAKPSKELKKAVSDAFHGRQALDIALFGRMLADAPDLNTDASAQVAHAISVDRVTQEYDYFTAVDDLASDDNAGASMIDTIGFNSSTLYRYATVNVTSLSQQLGDDKAVAEGVRTFLEAFVRSMPTGKQNTFANRTLPVAVLVAVRDDQPVNAVTAFESPIRADEDESVSHKAEERLAVELGRIADVYGTQPLRAWWTAVDGGGEVLAGFGEQVDFSQMLVGVRDYLLMEAER